MIASHRGRLLAVAAGAVFVAAPLASANQITLNALNDTTLLASSRYDYNLGANSKIQVGRTDSADNRSLIRFDVGALPAYQQIDSITLKLTVSGGENGMSNRTEVYEIAADNVGWIEGTGADVGDKDTTGSTYAYREGDSQTPWAGSAGLGSAGTDYIDTLLASATFTGTPTVGEVVSFTFAGDANALTAILDRWTAPGGNAGLLLLEGLTQTQQHDRVQYRSREDSAGGGPRLVVDYAPAPAPEPASLALLGLGGLLMLPRRRKVVSC